MSEQVSAIPSELMNWASWARGSDDKLQAAGRDLNRRLEDLYSAIDPSLLPDQTPAGDDLVAYAVRNAATDGWVGRVGQAFASAARAGFIGPLAPSSKRTMINQPVTCSAAKLASLVGDDPAALGADQAAAACLASQAMVEKGTGVDPSLLRQLEAHAGDQAFLQAFFQELGTAGNRSLAYLRGLNLSVPAQLDLVRTTPLLQFIRKHPDAARNAGLTGLDGALFQPGGLAYGASPGSWSPYDSMRPGSQEAWDRAVGFSGWCAPDGATFGYQGGGFIIGPDGRQYPLVDPSVNQNGTTYYGDTPWYKGGTLDDLDGHDPGWTTLYSLDGVDSFGPAPSGSLRWWAFWAGTAGVDPAPNEDGLQQFISVTPGGWPSFDSTPTIPATPAAPPTMYDQRLAWRPIGNGEWAWVDLDKYNPSQALMKQYPYVFKGPQPGSAATEDEQGSAQGDAALGGMTLVGISGEGLADATTLGNPNLRYYTVTFQQNQDGRIRAILRTYRVVATEDDNGQPAYVILPYATSMAPDGALQNHGMNFLGPKSSPVPVITAQGPSVSVGTPGG